MRWMVTSAVLVAASCSGDKSEDSATPAADDTQTGTDTSPSGDTSDSSGDSADTSGDTAVDTGKSGADPAEEAVEAMADAAEAFLASLSKDQQSETWFSMDDPARKTWSNLPLAMYDREGILTGDLTDAQLALAFSLLQASLSSQGYDQARNIISVDEYHLQKGDESLGEDLYSISIFGEPSSTEPWSWQLDGHHLCFTFTVNVDQVSMSPALWGVNPLTIPDGEMAGLRVMGDEVDRAFALLESLSEDQRALAIVSDQLNVGLIAGPDSDDYTIPEELWGLPAADMSASQQALLLELAEAYILDMEDTHAALRLAEVAEGVEDLNFAWIGSTLEGEQYYWRILGPTLLIELDLVNGNDHIHSVYRDPGNDYGENILGEHYARFPH